MHHSVFLLEVELKAERAAVFTAEREAAAAETLPERVPASVVPSMMTVLRRLRVQRVLSHVELLPLLRIRQHVLRVGNVDELLLCVLLLLGVLEIVRVPFLGEFPVRLFDLSLVCVPEFTLLRCRRGRAHSTFSRRGFCSSPSSSTA